jgi:tetratricopeptide (TPR) repeat protein
VQAEVAARIAQSLAVELLPEQSSPTGARRSRLSDVPERPLLLEPARAMPGFTQAITYFGRRARRSDVRGSARGPGATHTAQAEYYNMVPRAALETAQPIAERALQLDPHLAHAHSGDCQYPRHAALGLESRREGFKQAIALNPSSDGAHRWYGLLLAGMGRCEEAVREARRARELDHSCLVVGTSAAWIAVHGAATMSRPSTRAATSWT